MKYGNGKNSNLCRGLVEKDIFFYVFGLLIWEGFYQENGLCEYKGSENFLLVAKEGFGAFRGVVVKLYMAK